MRIRNFVTAAAFACAAITAPAFAQDAPPAEAGATDGAGLTVGATVHGPDGQPVGTIEVIEGENVLINTGTMTAALPASTFGTGESGPTLGWNKADLEAAITAADQEASAAVAAALVPGTDLFTVDGVRVGTISEIGDAGEVVVQHETGPIALPAEQITMQDGKLTFLATAADLEAAVSAQTGA